MSEEERRILETAPTAGSGQSVIQVVRVLAKLALERLDAMKEPPYHHLGIEADGFITVYPPFKN